MAWILIFNSNRYDVGKFDWPIWVLIITLATVLWIYLLGVDMNVVKHYNKSNKFLYNTNIFLKVIIMGLVILFAGFCIKYALITHIDTYTFFGLDFGGIMAYPVVILMMIAYFVNNHAIEKNIKSKFPISLPIVISVLAILMVIYINIK